MPRKNLYIHDSTLRDGEQMPGIVFTRREKLELAEKFVRFGVNEIDIMPAVSHSEALLAKELAEKYPKIISATCRMKKEDINQVYDLGIKNITLFAPVSDIFLSKVFCISREENLKRSLEGIDYASKLGMKISFAAMDATRADYGYLKEFAKNMSNKVEIFFIADSIGHLRPSDTRKFVYGIKKIAKCRIGMHVHNDFSMATANTIEGILAGADAFSGTFTGIGERAGNAPIEEVCLGLKILENMELDVRYDMISEICSMVEKHSGICLNPHKPISGKNIFSHESGIHTDALLKDPRTFEPFEPEIVGGKRKFIFGKHSGKSSLRHVMKKANRDIAEEHLDGLLKHIKNESEIQKRAFSEEEVVRIFGMIQKGDMT